VLFPWSTLKEQETAPNTRLVLIKNEKTATQGELCVALFSPLKKLPSRAEGDVNIWEEPEPEEIAQGAIEARTLNQLIILLSSEVNYDVNYLKTFLYTYRSFTTPEVFLQKLIERFGTTSTAFGLRNSFFFSFLLLSGSKFHLTFPKKSGRSLR
jgi:hypothetical protein